MSRLRPTEPAARLFGVLACGYAAGLVPSADIVARRVARDGLDLRDAGSGNPGALNAYRLLGRRAGVVVALADIAKGVAACAVGRAVAGPNGAHAAGVGAVAAHCYPVTRGLRGGIGAATSFGQCLATFPVFAPVDAALATGLTRLPGPRRPQRCSCRPPAGSPPVRSGGSERCRTCGDRSRLPVANAATAAVIASRGLVLLRRRGSSAVRDLG